LQVNRSNNRGILIGGRGKFHDTEISILNPTDHPIEIREATNAKPCCGIVSLEPPAPTVLRPGASVKLKVRLKLGELLGPLSHRTLLATNEPGQEPIEIWNLADVKPELWVEPKESGMITLRPGTQSIYRFVLHSNGNGEVAPISLDQIELRTNLPVRWLSKSITQSHENELIEASREGEVTLPSDGSIGAHVEELRFEHQKQLRAIHPIQWERLPAIRSSPEALLFTNSRGQPPKTLIIRATDDREFKILGVDDKEKLLQASIEPSHRSRTHRIDIVFRGPKKSDGP
jgi:hypothetical protein